MTWLRRIAWIAVALVTALIAASVYLDLPLPKDALVIDQATYYAANEPGKEVRLPLTVLPRRGRQPDTMRLAMSFERPILGDHQLFLFVPNVNRRLSVMLNGERLFDSAARTLWTGPGIGASTLIHLPRALLRPGVNELVVVLASGQFTVPTHISRLYVGTEAVLAPHFKLRVFLEDRLKTMALAAHVLLGLGIIFAYFYRPKDPLFSWLAAFITVSLLLSIGMFVGFQSNIRELLPYIGSVAPTLGFLALGIALLLIGVTPPRALPVVTIIFPVFLVLPILYDPVANRVITTMIVLPFLIAAFIAATGVVAWGALWRGVTDAKLMLSPFFLVSWFLVRDVSVSTDLVARPHILVTPYVRPLIVAALLAVLMRRLALSLGHLDRANENLNRKLAEQEEELAALHHEERIEAARIVREQERQRLTRDLHDGISGHLVSIIAMSERSRGNMKQIEQAAREALGDLRLVIYSLDLGDRDLLLALANFRERLVPQLQRMGVELDWSTSSLPEVSGVTPGNALTILRILQEAITNALKHGPARKITVRGAVAPDGMVAILIENDGGPFIPANKGFGISNMMRRARQLNGSVKIESIDCGVRLSLLLPSTLPDFLDPYGDGFEEAAQ